MSSAATPLTATERRLLDWLLRPEVEGGHANHPRDKGGATAHGITAARWGEYSGLGRAATPQEMLGVDVSMARTFYLEEYLRAPLHHHGCLPWPVAVATFDTAVLFGAPRTHQALQELLGVEADRMIGDATITAAWLASWPDVVLGICRWRVARHLKVCTGDPDQGCFLGGWLNRCLLLAAQANVQGHLA